MLLEVFKSRGLYVMGSVVILSRRSCGGEAGVAEDGRRISSFPSCVESQGVSVKVAHLGILRRPSPIRASRYSAPAAQDDSTPAILVSPFRCSNTPFPYCCFS